MGNLGFDVRDYSTGTPLAPTDLYVLVPRRDATLPALQEAPESSFRKIERRRFFPITRAPGGLFVVADVPNGVYDVRIDAPRYVPFATTVVAPLAAPVSVELHRDASYPFASEDTLLRGLVVEASGAPHTGFDVQLVDLTEPLVPQHRVPLNAKGEFVIFVPEKQTTGAVRIDVYHSTGTKSVNVPNVTLHRPNVLPLTTVP